MGAAVSSGCYWSYESIPTTPPEVLLYPSVANGISVKNGAHETKIYQQSDGVFRVEKVGGVTNVQYWNLASYKIFTGTDSSDLALQHIPNIGANEWLIQVTVGAMHLSAYLDIFLSVSGNEIMRIKAVDGAVGIGTVAPGEQLEVADRGSGLGGNIKVAGTVGSTFKWGAGQSAPTLATPPVIINGVYGGNGGNLMGEPAVWLLVDIGGTQYVIPGY